MNICNFFCIVFFYFFNCWTLLLILLNVCTVTYANQTNQIKSNNKRITFIPPFIKRSLQQQTSTLTLTLTNIITASNGGEVHQFGGHNAVAISNNRIVVGAYGYNDYTGVAYLFLDPANPSSGRSYSQMAILLANDGEVNDRFGNSVDIDGDIIVVGATEFDSNGNGAVYIFRIEDNDKISQIAKITAQNGVTYDLFGTSVAIHGNFILVGANGVDKNGISAVGSAYLFVNPSSDSNNQQWTQIMQFQPNDLTEGDLFGWSVVMEDQIAVIGTRDYYDANAAYVFAPVDENNFNSLSLWTQMAKLTGPTDSIFGYSVAVAGNTIVVGAHSDDNINGIDAGAVFVFTASSSSTWTQTNILLAANGAAGDYFGTSVAISKDASTIVVGAIYDDYSSTITYSGAAYLFRNSNTTTTTTTVGWTQVGKYVAADPDTNDVLGSSIAIEDSVVVVGSSGDDSYTGSVYILDTGNSSPPMTTTDPIQTTTDPTAVPVEPTLQPTTVSPTTEPTNPTITNLPTTVAPDSDNSNNPSLPPVTLTPTTNVPIPSTPKPTPPNNNTTSSTNDRPTDDTNSNSDNNTYIIIATIGGVVVLALGFGFFNYRLKRDRLRIVEQQQQQQQIIPPPLPPFASGNNAMAVVNASETPMADVIFPNITPTTEDQTMEAEAFLDPPPAHAPPPPPAAVGKMDVVDAEKGLPRYKDQARTTGPTPAASNIPSSGQNRNSQRTGDPEELPGTRFDQQRQQQQLGDPPATVNLFQEPLPTYKDQVLGEL